MTFPSISPKQSFPALESEILAYWKANNTFQKSIDSRPEDNPYRFYDGPPFITGVPHYGNLLSSIVKDVVGRYWTMRGKRVDRVWGWDCHGLPIEEKVQKKLGLASNKDIEERGVKEFIDGCYEYTKVTSDEWNWYIDKIGRWVDTDNAYRTMDQDYMESVMWVFSQLWDKGLIYEGKRVSLYSWKLGTPISNFEVAMDDTYQTVDDPAITVKFKPEIRKACGIIVENSKGEILLGHNKKGYWSFPGGKGEEGETHAECARRELLEETGIDYAITEDHSVNFEQYDMVDGTVFDNRRYKINIGDTPVTNAEPDKFHEWRFFAADAIPEDMFEPSRYAYDGIRAGKTQKNLPLSILAWTTTPWTIVANMALAVRNDIDYVLVENNGEQFIVAKNRVESVFKGKGENSVIREFKGSDLVGLGYTPPFPEYYHEKNGDRNHRIYHADFITDTDGTGIGHEAPEFGDVDFQLAKKEGIFISEAMDEAGKYTAQIFDYEGTHYQDANKINIERMKENGTLFKNESITHRVPFCPRSATPLVQKAQKSWFIDIQSQKDKLLAANEQINWFPEHLKFGRFAKGIESAPDWCISRTRYWGAPMPVWQTRDGSERVVVSSREEIFEMNKSYGQLTKIIFVRHGQTDYNLKDLHDFEGKASLTDAGHSRANLLSEWLQDEKVDMIYSSPLSRCIDTMTPFAQKTKKEIVTDERLVDYKFDCMQDQSWSEAPTGLREKLRNWDGHDITGCETMQEVYARIDSFMREIIMKNPGKTIVICTHGGPIVHMRKFLHQFDWKTAEKKYTTQPDNTILKKESALEVSYVFSDSCAPLNLHKPYIDSILLANQKAKKAKKILGIHGKGTDITKGSWKEKIEQFAQYGIDFEAFQFDQSEDPTYESWKNTFETIDFTKYDTIFTESLGGVMTTKYLAETGKKVPRIVMLAPGRSNKVEAGLKPNIHAIYQSIESLDIKNIADEIIVLHAKDDETVPYINGKAFGEEIGARFIGTETGNHMFKGQYTLIAGLIQFGEPLKRITEVLDVWMDSGSMPYAQVHFPFAGFEDASIRKAETDEEKTACFAFFEKMWKEEFDMDFQNRPNTSYEWIREDFWKSNVFYISDGDTVISSIQLSSQIKENNYVPMGASVLGRIGTVQEFRGKGHGTKLIKKALSYLSKQGTKEVYLNAEIKNIDFYKSFGFIQIQDTPEERGNTSAVYMKKTLSKMDELQALVFPADFIAEYVGQVRAWFYVMHVLGVLLNPNNEPVPTPSFTNVITTGVINGNDGRKMSKSFGNYPDPRITIEKYGADPIRFYMLNSPLLSGGDMDFKEEQIVETIKSVMLPLWNTYSFFTTYANIDNWQKNTTDTWFIRHGETEVNESGRVNGGGMDTSLTPKGVDQARSQGKEWKKSGVDFDVIVTSSKIRTKETARYIADELGFTGIWDECAELGEQNMGDYEGRLHDELKKEWSDKHGNEEGWTRIYRDNTTEGFDVFTDRIISGFKKIQEKYPGKKILIVGHGGTGKAFLKHFQIMDREEALWRKSGFHNCDTLHLPGTPLTNPLDRWIISKLQVLIGQVHDAMDAYDVSRACRAIVDYMDHLTNWYVRLSRRRFWESGMTPDKESAYETLYTVLTEVSKLLAPFMPFISESIFQGLTGKESVHLEYTTHPARHLISNELNRDMEKCERIVSLGLALRSRKNIRVRQPLSSVTITEELDEYYEKIIKDELNVKEIKKVNPTSLAKKIAKPDAKKIGPKYGKSVQEIIIKAKNGEFEETDTGIKVGEFILEKNEYAMEYLPLQEGSDVEGGYGMVISLDTSITEALKLEGYARDIVRLIQDMRKEAAYNVTDRINISITGDDSVKNIITHFGNMIAEETLGTIAESLSDADVSKEEILDENITVNLSVKAA